MIYVVGDIHGEISKLKKLILNIYQYDKKVKLIFIGDYVNKGENSKETLDYLTTLKNSIFLMGNHEYYFLEFIKNGSYSEKLEKYAKNTTFIDFNMNLETIKVNFYLPYKSFFDKLKPYYLIDKYFIAHAGVSPKYANEPLDKIPIKEFLFNRYDFLEYQNKIHGRIAIFGHTGFNYPYYDGFKIGIDTAAVYSKDSPLTAFCIEEESFMNDQGGKYYLKDFQLNCTPWINRRKPYRMKKK
jgi:serine/threonine protein phosphatase 1